MPPTSDRPENTTSKGASLEQFSLFTSEEVEVAAASASVPPAGPFSNYVVYVDESGDHGMQTVDPNYPVSYCRFACSTSGITARRLLPALQKFKFNHFGHDLVVLHEMKSARKKASSRSSRAGNTSAIFWMS
jgi:hypothetical protein